MSNPFVTLLGRLAEAQVNFVVVGGFAGVTYGCTYTTQDVDICCDFSPTNLLRLNRALADLHPVHRMMPARKPLELTEQSVASFSNLYLDTDLGQLDCLSQISGVGDYASVAMASIEVEAEGVRLRILGIDALISAKKAMNRPRDREAIIQLEAIRASRQQSDNG
jgi:hypothetical protein